MPNLGELLAQNIVQEKKAATDSAAALDQMRTAEARKKFLTGKAFFDEARDYFTSSIQQHAAVKTLFMQVGGKTFSSADVNCHPEFCAILAGYQARDQKLGPDSLFDPKRFASLWSEFQAWSLGQGLVASWHSCWDVGGMDSWWQLRVAPSLS